MGTMVSTQGIHLQVFLSNLKSYTDCADREPPGPLMLSGMGGTIRMGRLLGTKASYPSGTPPAARTLQGCVNT